MKLNKNDPLLRWNSSNPSRSAPADTGASENQQLAAPSGRQKTLRAGMRASHDADVMDEDGLFDPNCLDDIEDAGSVVDSNPFNTPSSNASSGPRSNAFSSSPSSTFGIHPAAAEYNPVGYLRGHMSPYEVALPSAQSRRPARPQRHQPAYGGYTPVLNYQYGPRTYSAYNQNTQAHRSTQLGGHTFTPSELRAMEGASFDAHPGSAFYPESPYGASSPFTATGQADAEGADFMTGFSWENRFGNPSARGTTPDYEADATPSGRSAGVMRNMFTPLSGHQRTPASLRQIARRSLATMSPILRGSVYDDGSESPDRNGIPIYRSTELSFDTLPTAMASVAPKQVWIPPQDDPTVPQTPEQMQDAVRKLMWAMMSDSIQEGDVKNPHANGILRDYNEDHLEITAWKILAEMLRLHEDGCYDDYVMSLRDRQWDFATRLNHVVTLFRRWKNAASDAIKGHHIATFVAAPCEHDRRKRSNAKGNANKAAAIRLAKTLSKR
ncbi:hypothetical protein BU16DRAFT_537990 [Lophium mytilinum]|uniref:Uncharacterized protein n=1 Tax=Lophium mytilinum TaxID=390894 RepID=A0A6A6QX99_9PEZI|nr:hypothetical protein BU16DRAFT_537990 [Lophium mytilinum]